MNAPSLRLTACAKINLCLEVLGRRADGYHDVATVLQTVTLTDTVDLTEGEADFALNSPAEWNVPGGPENLVVRAIERYAAEMPSLPALAVTLTKAIPSAAGLGGGSSDCAAVLRGLHHISDTPLPGARLVQMAASLGSDVAFFLRGGTQIATGRGEQLTQLPDLPETWLVLVTPRLGEDGKTARLFGLLDGSDYSSGARTDSLTEALRSGDRLAPRHLYNAFDRVAATAFPGLEPFRAALQRACGYAMLCGAGPSLFALAANEQEAKRAAAALVVAGMPAAAVRSASAAESTSVLRPVKPAA